jgi:hypothetical protein
VFIETAKKYASPKIFTVVAQQKTDKMYLSEKICQIENSGIKLIYRPIEITIF